MERILRYDSPASEWNEALPIGNGKLGAMVFGTIEAERLDLNEDSLWYGGPRKRTNPDGRANLDKIRSLVFEGKIHEAEQLTMLAMAGIPDSPAHYVPLGSLELGFTELNYGVYQEDGIFSFRKKAAPVSDYRRELDLERAISSVSYSQGGVRFERECFASAPGEVIALRIKADKPGSVSCKANFLRERYCGVFEHPDDRTLVMRTSGGGEGSVSCVAALRVVASGGTVRALGETIVVEGADEAVFLVAAATSYRHGDPAAPCFAALDAAERLGYEQLRERHVADYRSYFDRMDLRFSVPPDTADAAASKAPQGDTRNSPNVSSPTIGAILDSLRAGTLCDADKVELAELYFHFGRYLLISSSRPGSLATTLQGIWNREFLPPWGCKYTININTEMNYWPAEKCGLGDCHQSLFDLLERMLPNGRRVAREMYGCRGFVAHHNTDLWGDCDPVDHWIPATVWPMGAAWLCLDIWEHFEYSGDRAFLERYYPIMREAAEFFLDYLVEDSRGRLVTCPSASPENTYILPSGERGSLCYGPALDNQILRALFADCVKASATLGLDAELARRFGETASRLPALEIGKQGGIMEWPEDYEEAEVGHRHIAQLFALYPDDSVSLAATPELAAAAKATLERRLSHGGGHTGWSKAWIINMRARLGQGEEAWEDLMGLFAHSTLPSLLDNHPPFQIDGNFGGAAGILEMLLQCVRGEILLLPALPRELPSGSVRGVRAKGGFELDFEWDQCRLTRVRITSHLGGECRLRVGAAREPRVLATEAGGSYELKLG